MQMWCTRCFTGRQAVEHMSTVQQLLNDTSRENAEERQAAVLRVHVFNELSKAFAEVVKA